MFYLAIVNKILRHCHSWLAQQYNVIIDNVTEYFASFLSIKQKIQAFLTSTTILVGPVKHTIVTFSLSINLLHEF